MFRNNNSGENPNPSASEQSGEDNRGVYEQRGQKALNAMNIEELLQIANESDLEQYSIEELEAARSRLKEEYRRLFGTEYQGSSTEEEPPVEGDSTSSDNGVVDEGSSASSTSASPIEGVQIVVPLPSGTSEGNSGSNENTPAPIASEAGASSPESATAEEAGRRYNSVRRKRKANLKRFLTRAAAIALTAATIAGIGFAGSKFMNRNRNNNAEATTQETVVDTDTTEDTETTTEDEEKDKDEDKEKDKAEKIGIIDGYGKPGMWLSENKSSSHAFSSASEVAKICNYNEHEMVKYLINNQVESFADFLAGTPGRLQSERFKGLGLGETESKLESLSDEEYEKTRMDYNNLVDKGRFRDAIVDGKCKNALMDLQDKAGAVNHENMKLVSCVTNENNLRVRELYWEDENGDEIGSILIKMQPIYNDKGEIVDYDLCMQVLHEIDSPVFEDVPEIVETPSRTGSEGTNKTGSEGTNKTGSEGTKTGSEGTKTGSEGTKTGSEGTGSEGTGSEGTGSEGTGSEGTGSEGTGSEGTNHTPKNEEAQKENAGDRVDQRELDEDVTPKTSEEQDKENFQAIEKQKQEDEAKKAKDEETKKEQAQKESEAEKKAEERRQEEAKKEEKKSEPEKKHEEKKKEEADHSAEKAKEHSSSEQKESAKHEEKAREESQAREEKQSEANRAEPEHEKEAESKNNDNKEERQDIMEEGDF